MLKHGSMVRGLGVFAAGLGELRQRYSFIGVAKISSVM